MDIWCKGFRWAADLGPTVIVRTSNVQILELRCRISEDKSIHSSWNGEVRRGMSYCTQFNRGGGVRTKRRGIMGVRSRRKLVLAVWGV